MTDVNDFLTANQITTFADIVEADTIADMTSFEAIADNMLINWTFDGALVPDRGDLVAALRALPVNDRDFYATKLASRIYEISSDLDHLRFEGGYSDEADERLSAKCRVLGIYLRCLKAAEKAGAR